MSTKYTSNWETWKELCEQNDIDPYKFVDFGIDMGLGNSRNFEYTGDIPEIETEAQIFMKNWLETKEEK